MVRRGGGDHGETARRAYALIDSGRPEEALGLTEAAARRPDAGHALLAAHALALKTLGRRSDALAVSRRAAHEHPGSGVAWHNLASAFDEAGRPREALEAVDRAFALNVRGWETWMVAAHAHFKLMDYAAAEAAFVKVLGLHPGQAVAANELARLLWMRTGDWRQAVAPLRAARSAGAPEGELVWIEADLLRAGGRSDELEAHYRRALARAPRDPAVLCAVAQGAFEAGELARAARLAEEAVAAHPAYGPGLLEFAMVRLAQGRPADAFEAARRATQIDRSNQAAWGWLATAARALNHEVYAHLYDYGSFVREFTLPTPQGWSSLPAFLGDLSETLRGLHRMQAHPADQTLRNGTQTATDLTLIDDPVLKAFFSALDGPIRAYIEALGAGADPLRSRNAGGYRTSGAWSVLLQPNGYHVNHLHPLGWVSSAFYVETPSQALGADGREGWIKFGEPPFATQPAQPPEHFVRPEPGKLVLFPSYMWHGTVPFTTPENRMTIAFDLTPAPMAPASR